MELRNGQQRHFGHRDGDDKPRLPTFDLPHVWPDGHKLGRVAHASWVAILNLTGGDVHARLWWPGYDPHGQKCDLVHGQMVAVPAKAFGTYAIVVDSIVMDGKELEGDDLKAALKNVEFFWELTAFDG